MKSPEFLMTRGVNGSQKRLNWLRILGLFLILAAGATVISLFLVGSDEEEPRKARDDKQQSWNPKIAYNYDPQKEQPQPEAPAPMSPEAPAEEVEEEEKGPDPRVDILREASSARIERFSSDLKRFEEFRGVAMAAGAGGSCEILPGDKAFLRPIDIINTDNGGTVVAELAESIPGQGCDIAMEAGAKFVGVVSQDVQFAQKTAGITFETITTNDGRVIESKNIGSSQMGSGGVPGEVDRHMMSKFAGVAVATAVDLADSYLSSEGDGYRVSIDNTGSLLEDFIRPYITRKDTISRDPTKSRGLISVTFTQKLSM